MLNRLKMKFRDSRIPFPIALRTAPFDPHWLPRAIDNEEIAANAAAVIRRIEADCDIPIRLASPRYLRPDENGNLNLGRFIMFQQRPMILVLHPKSSGSLARFLDTIIHEGIHAIGHPAILHRWRAHITDRNSPAYWLEEYVARRGAEIVGRRVGLNRLVDPEDNATALANIRTALLDIYREDIDRVCENLDGMAQRAASYLCAHICGDQGSACG